MKIEKVNDHQIRCTLTKADLADRELKISELAYGTEKAKSLFRDMMQQAAIKFGFEAEDIPLMIEAIPLNSDCIVLIITKVEDPEELDTRFSKFAPSVHDDDSLDDMIQDLNEGADDVLDLFRRIHEGRTASGERGDAEARFRQKRGSASDHQNLFLCIPQSYHPARSCSGRLLQRDQFPLQRCGKGSLSTDRFQFLSYS